MRRYYFHTQTTSRSTDNEGMEFATPAQARCQAIATCGEMMRDAPEGFWLSRPWSVVVTDDVGLVLWEIYVDGTASVAAPSLVREPSGGNG
jgi:hypothetical protein